MEPLDLRATRLLWEHKRVVNKCLPLLRGGSRTAHGSAYAEVVVLSHKLHLVAFSLQSEYGSSAVDKLNVLIDKLAHCETRALAAAL